MLKCMTSHARPRRRSSAPGFGLVELLLALGLPPQWGRRVLVYPRVTTRVNLASDVETFGTWPAALIGPMASSARSAASARTMGWPHRLPPRQRSDHEQRMGRRGDRGPGHGAPAGDAFTVGLSGLRGPACRSSRHRRRRERDVIVGNTSVLLGNGGTLDIPGLGLACGADGAVVDVVYYSGLVAGSSVAVVPTLPCPPRPPSLALQRRHRLATAPSVPDAVPGVPGRVAKPWGCSFPGGSAASCCAQRGASAAPNAGPHPGRA